MYAMRSYKKHYVERHATTQRNFAGELSEIDILVVQHYIR